jgi:hypothetical protein
VRGSRRRAAAGGAVALVEPGEDHGAGEADRPADPPTAGELAALEGVIDGLAVDAEEGGELVDGEDGVVRRSMDRWGLGMRGLRALGVRPSIAGP